MFIRFVYTRSFNIIYYIPNKLGEQVFFPKKWENF